jgi:hypothetical protein
LITRTIFGDEYRSLSSSLCSLLHSPVEETRRNINITFVQWLEITLVCARQLHGMCVTLQKSFQGQQIRSHACAKWDTEQSNVSTPKKSTTRSTDTWSVRLRTVVYTFQQKKSSTRHSIVLIVRRGGRYWHMIREYTISIENQGIRNV